MSGSRTDIARGFRDVDAEPDAEPYAAYLRRVSQRMAAEKEASYALLAPAPGRKLLDVGCGIGDDVQALAERVGPTGSVVGIDRSASLIQQARRRTPHPAARFLVADAGALPFADGTFDAARVERTLQHVENPARALGEMKRVVRAGGTLAASEPDWGTLAIAGADPRTTQAVCRTLCEHRIRHGSIGRELPGLFARLGLGAIEVHPVTLALTCFPVAADLLGIGQAGSDEWLDELRRSDSEGRFFASLTGFTVTGDIV